MLRTAKTNVSGWAGWVSQLRRNRTVTVWREKRVIDASDGEMLELLADKYAQMILQQTRDKAMSAKELSEECDISVSTVYRRAERLVECGLLSERRVAHPDGNHHSMYEARLNELTIRLGDEGFEITVSEKPTGDLADRFTEIWEGL